MKKLIFLIPCLWAFLVSTPGMGLGQKGEWLGSGGFGLILGPTLVMINPGLEYAYDQDLYFGTGVQMGFGGEGLLMTISGTIRALYGNEKSKYRPVAEAAFGMAMSSGLTKSSVGVHVMGGGGVEYALDKSTSLGMVLRFNFAPPVKGLFISWPLLIGRFRL